MRLVDNGQLDLDLPLKAYIERLRFSESQAEERITLRMLLSHTSGLPADSHSGSADSDGLERYIRERLLLYFFVAPPGRLYSYANAGFSLIGYIAQVVTGKYFSDLMQELVFDPLEMNRITLDPLVAITYSFALPHILREDQLHVLHHVSYGQAIAPAGGAYSTVVDLAHFAMMHLQHGRFHNRQLLSSSSILQMQTQQAIRYLAHPTGYGLGFELMTNKGVRCIGHSGSMSTFGSQLMLLPDKQLGFILMASRISFMKRLVSKLLDHLLDLPSESQRPGTTSPERTQWSSYTGSFLGVCVGLALISVEDDHLVLELNNQRLTLQEHSANVHFGFLPDSGSEIAVGFIPEAIEPVRYITIDENLCERFEYDPFFSPNPLTWVRFIGTYKEVDSGETITIQVTNGQLLLRHLLLQAFELSQ
jgi:CubicO group peptidase (beta-lactamase class C family)